MDALLPWPSHLGGAPRGGEKSGTTEWKKIHKNGNDTGKTSGKKLII